MGGLGTSTNINKSGAGMAGGNDANQINSNINESALDIENEFGYQSDEDSIFKEWDSDSEKEIPRLYKRIGINKDIKSTMKEVNSILKRYTEKSQTHEFLVKFNIMIDEKDNSSVASVIDQGKMGIDSTIKVPSEIIEKKQKKKFLRNETRFYKES